MGWVRNVPTFWVIYKFRGRIACGLFGFGNFRIAAVVSVRGAGVGVSGLHWCTLFIFRVLSRSFLNGDSINLDDKIDNKLKMYK